MSHNDSYLANMSKIRELKKGFDYPLNPDYQNPSKKHKVKLKYLTEYCKDNKIALSNNEETIMNLDLSKLKHQVWKNSVADIFDTGCNSKSDQEEELVDIMRNFDNINLSRQEIITML